MTEWQPIETAPKDGTAVLLWFENSHAPVIGSYHSSERYDHGKLVYSNAYWSWNGSWMIPGKLPAPTHWSRLPSGPNGDIDKESSDGD